MRGPTPREGILMLSFEAAALILRGMSDLLEEALLYAKQHSIWLERPVQLLRYVEALAAEVSRLREEVDRLAAEPNDQAEESSTP